MNRTFYLIATTLMLLASCSNSPEEKADKLIRENCRNSLVKADSYDPVETKLDSAFTPFHDPQFQKLAYDLAKSNQELEEIDEKIKFAKSSMNIWSNLHSNYSRNEYEERKTEYEKYLQEKESIEKRVDKITAKIKESLHKKPEFIGFVALHKFRAANNAGQTVFGYYYYLLDKDLSKIIIGYDMESDDFMAMSESIQQIKDENL